MTEEEFAAKDGNDAVGIFDADGKRHILVRGDDGKVRYLAPDANVPNTAPQP